MIQYLASVMVTRTTKAGVPLTKETPFRNTSGRPRPCAICNSQRVKESKVCQDCQDTWGVRLKEPWAVEAIRHSDNQARLVRQIREKERPLLYTNEK